MSAAIESRLGQLSDEQRRLGVDGPPLRVFVFLYDTPASPAMYLEAALDDSDPSVPVIVHNLRYYGDGMHRWDVGFVELLVLNELHELTHWAMTDEERERFERKSRRFGRPDGYWLNPTLIHLIRWLPGEPRHVFDGRPSLLARLGGKLRDRLFGKDTS